MKIEQATADDAATEAVTPTLTLVFMEKRSYRGKTG